MLMTQPTIDKVLSLTGLALIVITGILQHYVYPDIFISLGYVLGLILTLPATNTRITLIAALLSICLIASTFLVFEGEAAINTTVSNRIFILVEIILVCALALRSIHLSIVAQNRKTLMEGVFLHGTEGIILISESQNIILMNPFAEKLFGYTLSNLANTDIENIIPGFAKAYAKMQTESNEPLDIHLIINRCELEGRRKDATVFPIEISLNKYKSGNKTHHIIFVTDITLRKQTEANLIAKQKELEQANRELEAFTYSVSHDLRAPLRAVGGYAQMITEDYQSILDQEGQRLLLNIQQNAERMGKLIDDLLTFSRLGKKGLKKYATNMNSLTQAILKEINRTQPHHAKIIMHPLEEAYVDSDLIAQVLVNLISNAIKYSSKKENPEVVIQSDSTESEIIFSVTDNGAGFDPRYAHKLFGVFQRLHTEDEFEGTGVGLAIAQRVVQKHDGRIWACGSEGNGATFHFSLPRGPIQKPTQSRT